jgi:hypothetical protein
MEDINRDLDEAIRTKDVKAIRNILTTSMVQDPGFNNSVFENRLKRCLAAGLTESDIFVLFEGTPINHNQSAWTKDYYAEQRTEFRYNFSTERLAHLRKVGQKIYPSAFNRTSSYSEDAKKNPGGEGVYQKESRSYREDGEFPKWLIPAAVLGAAAIVLLFVLFG